MADNNRGTMTSPLDKLIQELRSANEARTSGDWHCKHHEAIPHYQLEYYTVHDGKTGFGDDIIADIDMDKPEAKHNAQFIALTANKLETLLQIITELKDTLKQADRRGHPECVCGWDASAALRKADQIAEGRT